MLVNSKEILQNAKKEGYALPAPDYIDADSARAFVKVAEELNRPLLLSFPQVLANMMPLDEAAAIGVALGKKAKVPVVLHLDHGLDKDFVEKAISLGFTSIMIDASGEDFEENVRITQEIVQIAHAKSVTVEAEIGHVGQGGNFAGFEENETVFTTVEEAARFVELTQVDSLAVSIGTIHGAYKQLKKPDLQFDRLHELAQAIDIPLVLHGGSGTGEENLHRSAMEGISKINVFTELLTGAMATINADKPKDYLALKAAADTGMASVLRHYYQVLGKDWSENE